MHQFLFRGLKPNHCPGGLSLSGGISTLADSPKDVWPRLGCVTPTLLAPGWLETSATSQCLFKLSLQWSSHSVLQVASKPPFSLAFFRITGISFQSFPYAPLPNLKICSLLQPLCQCHCPRGDSCADRSSSSVGGVKPPS